MILDYNFSPEKKEMTISYIDNTGNKQLLSFKNINKFSTYRYDPEGPYTTWNGCKASKKFTGKPNKFDIKEFIYNLSPDLQSKIEGRVFPKLYTFDIETQIKSKYDFTDPTVADMPILTISMVNPDLDCIVLGTKELGKREVEGIQKMFTDYLNSIQFYGTLTLEHEPRFKYIKFDTEEKMIRYFFERFVSKIPIIAGWNSIGYDWCYFVNRVKNFYPSLSVTMASIDGTTTMKNYTNKVGETIRMPHPNHTLVLDMMEVIDSYDLSVMGMKESMNLDYVAGQTLGAHKIDYDGSLQDLYEADYQRYVFYNAIDSILVQLIDKRFKTMNQFYLESLICKESIGKCFSKIALTEALIFKQFYKEGIKIVYEPKEDIERGELMGAYVKDPKPGKWEWMCCNDFASLYPSTMITCNISFENYMGKLGREFTEEEVERFRKDKNYFVSVNNNVYRNDRPYTLKVIERSLKEERDVNKYLSKKLDATIKSDLTHFVNGQDVEYKEYTDDVRKYVKDTFDLVITNNHELDKISDTAYFMKTLDDDITYLMGLEQAVKTLMNSIYGGSSHVSFYFYNMDMANDITGESRWLIHKMEEHIPKHFNEEWLGMKELHKELGIEVDEKKVNECLKYGDDMVTLVYGDSCSGDTIINCKTGQYTIEELFNKSNFVYNDRGKEFGVLEEDVLNFDGNKTVYNKIKWVIRHKTNKPKWRLTTNTQKFVEVTGDHSCIIWNGETMVTVVPQQIKKGDVVINDNGNFEQIENVECIGSYNNEYVYDIEVDTLNTNEHNFFGNGILIHNTDSVANNTIIQTNNGNKTIEQLFLENENNNKKVTHKGHELVSIEDKILNYNDNGDLEFQNARYIMRHKVSKPKWRLKTKSGKEIFVTNDHSMIVFRNGVKMEVKPYEIQKTDKILVVK